MSLKQLFRSTRIFSAATLTTMMLAAHSASAYINVYGGPTYTPGVGGFKDGWVTGVNDAGTAVKYDAADTEIGVRAIRWDGSGAAATELGNLGVSFIGFANSYANAINDDGTVVGNVEVYDESGGTLGYRAVRWAASGTVATELGNLDTDSDGFTYCDVYTINDAGTAVGIALREIVLKFRKEQLVKWTPIIGPRASGLPDCLRSRC